MRSNKDRNLAPMHPISVMPSITQSAWGYIDEGGDVVIKQQFDDATPFAEQRAAVRQRQMGLHRRYRKLGHTMRVRTRRRPPQIHDSTKVL